MKKFATASLAVFATALLATSAHAEKRWPNWYVGLHGGVNFSSDSNDLTIAGAPFELQTDDGYLVGASLGYVPPTELPFLNMTRYELEYTFRHNDIQSLGGFAAGDDLDSHTVMLNMLVDFANETRWTPYVGGGIGFNRIDLAGEDDTPFAWQLLAGIDYSPEAMPMTVWGLRYRYMNSEDAEYETGGLPAELEYDAHSVEAAARFRF